MLLLSFVANEYSVAIPGMHCPVDSVEQAFKRPIFIVSVGYVEDVKVFLLAEQTQPTSENFASLVFGYDARRYSAATGTEINGMQFLVDIDTMLVTDTPPPFADRLEGIGPGVGRDR